MKIFEHISDIKEYISFQKVKGKTVGLVPTMGYLHEGHASLIDRSAADNDITVVSVFVNPTQFAPNEDFASYPRDLAADIALAEAHGADIMFTPSAEEMYPQGYNTYVDVEELTQGLCGKARPTHFRGVTTVVCKLFNIAMPNRAYFGQKDAQQLAVITRMTRDLDMDITIVPCPIIRETDGLAKSSRNVYLSPDERSRAVVLHKSLCMASEMIANGERGAQVIRDAMIHTLESAAPTLIDYVEIVSADTLTPIAALAERVLITLAVKFGNTRLIDNVIVDIQYLEE